MAILSCPELANSARCPLAPLLILKATRLPTHTLTHTVLSAPKPHLFRLLATHYPIPKNQLLLPHPFPHHICTYIHKHSVSTV